MPGYFGPTVTIERKVVQSGSSQYTICDHSGRKVRARSSRARARSTAAWPARTCDSMPSTQAVRCGCLTPALHRS